MIPLKYNIVVTEQCNLNCSYCYMKNKTNYLLPEIVEKCNYYLPQIMKLFNCKNYDVVYFGGEPLLNYKLIQSFIPIFNQDNRCGHQTILTNGTLLNEDIIQFCNHKTHLSLSFDGLNSNISRPGYNIKDNYEKKKELLLKYNLNKFNIMISPSSLPLLVKNMDYFVTFWNIKIPGFTLVQDDIWTDEDIKYAKTVFQNLTSYCIDKTYERQELILPAIYRRSLLRMLVCITHGKPDYLCFAGKHGFALMPNGKLYPCARFGSLGLFDLFDCNTGQPNNENLNIFKNKNITDPNYFKKCHSCEIGDICYVGCYFSHFKNNCEPLESICKLTKIIFKETFVYYNEFKNNHFFRNSINNFLREVGYGIFFRN